MDLDEPTLTRFFGAAPTEAEPEEQEFFGSLHYRVREGPLILTVCFGTHHGDVTIALEREPGTEPVMHAFLNDVVAATVTGEAPLLTIAGAARGEGGPDSDPVPRARISLNPITVRLAD